MASEYLKWKYRDVKPDEVVELTPRQKRANWWYYHKWHVFLGVGLLALGVYLGARILGIGQVRPDYQVAYVGSAALPEDTAAALESALAELGTDCNGDGQVAVQLNQYVMGDGSGEGAVYAYAGSTRLMADLDSCESYFFLLEDPAGFQENYQVLRHLDGSLPRRQKRTGRAAISPGPSARSSRSCRWASIQKRFWTRRSTETARSCSRPSRWPAGASGPSAPLPIQRSAMHFGMPSQGGVTSETVEIWGRAAVGRPAGPERMQFVSRPGRRWDAMGLQLDHAGVRVGRGGAGQRLYPAG